MRSLCREDGPPRNIKADQKHSSAQTRVFNYKNLMEKALHFRVNSRIVNSRTCVSLPRIESARFINREPQEVFHEFDDQRAPP
jgi:hypothetical protein